MNVVNAHVFLDETSEMPITASARLLYLWMLDKFGYNWIEYAEIRDTYPDLKTNIRSKLYMLEHNGMVEKLKTIKRNEDGQRRVVIKWRVM